MLSHMVVKRHKVIHKLRVGLRVVLSHMVVKPTPPTLRQENQFESSVISYGSQTTLQNDWRDNWFESSVISYGSQTGLSAA